MKCKKSFLQSSAFVFALALLTLLLTPGGMLLWSQSSGPKSNNSDVTLQTWQLLSGKFQSELVMLRNDLNQALTELQQSKNYGQQQTNLLDQSLRRTNVLEAFNQQIGERMQEADEWNAELQDENIGLKAEVKIVKANGLRNTIIAGIAGIVLGLLIPFIIKLLRAVKIIP
jgi:membrane protein implicated in regulation of membrane protease activity